MFAPEAAMAVKADADTIRRQAWHGIAILKLAAHAIGEQTGIDFLRRRILQCPGDSGLVAVEARTLLGIADLVEGLDTHHHGALVLSIDVILHVFGVDARFVSQ